MATATTEEGSEGAGTGKGQMTQKQYLVERIATVIEREQGLGRASLDDTKPHNVGRGLVV